MPPSLATSSLAPSSLPPSGFSDPTLSHPGRSLSAGTAVPRDFGQRRPIQGDRWPMPLAAAAILGLSVTFWFVLIQAGRTTLALVGL